MRAQLPLVDSNRTVSPWLSLPRMADVVLGCARRFSRDEDEESCTRLYSPLCVGAGVTVGAGVGVASPLVR